MSAVGTRSHGNRPARVVSAALLPPGSPSHRIAAGALVAEATSNASPAPTATFPAWRVIVVRCEHRTICTHGSKAAIRRRSHAVRRGRHARDVRTMEDVVQT